MTNKAVNDGEVLAAQQTVIATDIDEMPSLACSMWALSMLRYNSFHTAQPRASSGKKNGQHIMLKVPAKTYH